MKDYRAIFDAVEKTLFAVGSKKLPLEKIHEELEESKHLEGKRFSDDDYYRTLVHIIFYSGFRAQTVTDKLHVIDRHFPTYAIVATYGEQEVNAILRDGDMIRNHTKIRSCLNNAKIVEQLVHKHGSLQNYIDSFEPLQSAGHLFRLKDDLQNRFAGLGDITVYHFLTDIGLPVLKPDRVIVRIFTRLGLVKRDASPSEVIEQGKKFAEVTGHPIRYIDLVLVAYGQVQTRELGIEKGICLEANPSCSKCGVSQYCDYHAQDQAH